MQTWRVGTFTFHRYVISAAIFSSVLMGGGRADGQATATPTATPSTTPTPTASPIPDSKKNYESDRVIFPNNVTVTVIDGVRSPFTAVLRGGTALLGVGQSTAGKVDFVVSQCGPYLGMFPSLYPKAKQCNSPNIVQTCETCDVLVPDDDKCKDKCKDVEGEEKMGKCVDKCKADMSYLQVGSIVQVAATELDAHPPNRYGFAFGALVVPFKFQLTGSHDLTGSAAIGPYLGYRWQSQYYGLGVTFPTLFGGASNLSVNKSSGNGETQVLGFSYGGACLVDVKNTDFQAGIVLGWDRTGDGQSFKYNNKPWLGFQIGYSFTRAGASN